MSASDSFHQHYAMVAALSAELAQTLKGYKLVESYTLSKEELIFVFGLNEQFFTIKLIQQYQTFFLFFEAHRPDKPSNAQPCFEQVWNTSITVVNQHPFNRSFEMVMENGKQLVFKLYGGLANVLLFDGGSVSDLFRKSIQNDWELSATSFYRTEPLETIDIKGFYVYKQRDIQLYYVSIIPRHDELVKHTQSAMEAYSIFSKGALSHYRFVYLKQQLFHSTQQQITKTQLYLKQLEETLRQQSLRVPDEEIGHIIMANLHMIQPQAVSVELHDFYRDQLISVKLKKDLNAQQNAAYYYRKAKNSAIEKAMLEEQLGAFSAKKKLLEDKLTVIEAAQSYRDLKPFVREETPVQKQSPFRRFVVNGFDIWVGKNAGNNDELTVRFSHKNDLWLHAKDVTGSHVLIKWKPGKTYPNDVIEAAAQIAAYYSKLKGSGLVPVVFTPKKFVRKPKGAEPGSVVVDKEEVIMVSPKLPV